MIWAFLLLVVAGLVAWVAWLMRQLDQARAEIDGMREFLR